VLDKAVTQTITLKGRGISLSSLEKLIVGVVFQGKEKRLLLRDTGKEGGKRQLRTLLKGKKQITQSFRENTD